ncbi:Uncharacterised protein [Metamycoplasma cloacale]|uniref:Uncharacterized protein n=1 Tax=Metamycoplasma cloacale TaxID=92401 RepID=A0A2Z4LM30_9BACT|nr:hypothetical protein [Metamycoplasma cloacale]AWX42754.1 hypothetical protein DK849_01560 [Metamycoplasma cloacale]VEU79431.1 Uncharacterised protein [Metamycoplasma cloacale]
MSKTKKMSISILSISIINLLVMIANILVFILMFYPFMKSIPTESSEITKQYFKDNPEMANKFMYYIAITSFMLFVNVCLFITLFVLMIIVTIKSKSIAVKILMILAIILLPLHILSIISSILSIALD